MVFFIFYSNFKRHFCKQTVENLIMRRILRRLIWFCTACRCPTEQMLGLYGLKVLYFVFHEKVPSIQRTTINKEYLVGWFCCFTSQVNSYGHCGTVSSPNHTFSWAGLNKRLTSNSCTYFRLHNYCNGTVFMWLSSCI